MPSVSVIITAYNASGYIIGTLESLQKQTFADFECLIVDDGSSDDTATLVQNFGDYRFKLLQPGRLGRGKALNWGIQNSQGEFIAIQDADDFSHPQRLQIELELLQNHPDISVLGSDQKLLESDANDSCMIDWKATGGNIKNVSGLLLIKNPISHTSLFVRKSALSAVNGYDESRRSLFDWDLLLRLFSQGFPIYCYSEPLVLKRIHSGQYFEAKRRYLYVKNCYVLQMRALKILQKSFLWAFVFWGLFIYRLMPRSFRIAANRMWSWVR